MFSFFLLIRNSATKFSLENILKMNQKLCSKHAFDKIRMKEQSKSKTKNEQLIREQFSKKKD